ncbi:MAG: AbrB/MazE/SpoVT family DNA-binding domain-containing protein [Nitrospinae bacterium]|nr:AbrB/MazE/SpoVT family DNA-binding domain-containing protein [Nitrospinota bacterium]
MSAVTVSPKYQVVIPKEARAALNIRPGDKLEVFPYNIRLELVPVRPVSDLRGFLKGIDTTVNREAD